MAIRAQLNPAIDRFIFNFDGLQSAVSAISPRGPIFYNMNVDSVDTDDEAVAYLSVQDEEITGDEDEFELPLVGDELGLQSTSFSHFMDESTLDDATVQDNESFTKDDPIIENEDDIIVEENMVNSLEDEEVSPWQYNQDGSDQGSLANSCADLPSVSEGELDTGSSEEEEQTVGEDLVHEADPNWPCEHCNGLPSSTCEHPKGLSERRIVNIDHMLEQEDDEVWESHGLGFGNDEAELGLLVCSMLLKTEPNETSQVDADNAEWPQILRPPEEVDSSVSSELPLEKSCSNEVQVSLAPSSNLKPSTIHDDGANSVVFIGRQKHDMNDLETSALGNSTIPPTSFEIHQAGQFADSMASPATLKGAHNVPVNPIHRTTFEWPNSMQNGRAASYGDLKTGDERVMDVPIIHLAPNRQDIQSSSLEISLLQAKSMQKTSKLKKPSKREAARVMSAVRKQKDEEFERLKKENKLSTTDINRLKPKKSRRAAKFDHPSPSRFCHVCSRTPKNVRLAVCSNIREGVCRKVVCEKCFIAYNLGDFEAANNLAVTNWRCTHCTHTCPARAQCRTYQRVNDQLRLDRLLNNKKRGCDSNGPHNEATSPSKKRPTLEKGEATNAVQQESPSIRTVSDGESHTPSTVLAMTPTTPHMDIPFQTEITSPIPFAIDLPLPEALENVIPTVSETRQSGLGYIDTHISPQLLEDQTEGFLPDTHRDL